jgi:hypothetical protein
MTETNEPYAEEPRQLQNEPGVVFAEPEIPFDGPIGWAEAEVNFLIKSTRQAACVARKTINNWYSRFPDPDGKFRARLTSPKGTDHQVALDELYVYEHLTRSAEISYEEGGTGPDFRIYHGADYLGAVEVLSLFMASDWSGQQNQHSRIADELNKRLRIDRWFIDFEIIRLDRDPSFTKLASWVNREISSLPPVPETEGRTCIASYRAQDIQLDFSFIRSERHPAGTRDRIVCSGPVIGGLVRSSERLLVALTKKAGNRYNVRNAPFALCVGVHDPFCGLDDLETAIYGHVQYAYQVGGTGDVSRSRANDGFFGRLPSAPKGKNRRISCVFAVCNWYPWISEESVILRFDNPFADRPFPGSLIPAAAQVTRVQKDRPGITFDWLPVRPSLAW